MATPVGGLRQRAWVERARVAALAARILEVDRLFLRHDGAGMLTAAEAQTLRSLADRLGLVEP